MLKDLIEELEAILSTCGNLEVIINDRYGDNYALLGIRTQINEDGKYVIFDAEE